MRIRLFASALVLVAILFVAGACPHYNRSPAERLRLSVMKYNEALRWQQWKAASIYVPPDKRSDWVVRKEAQQESLRVTEWEVRDVAHNEAADPPEAAVVVEFTWHRYPSLTMHHTRVRQAWKMLDDSWILEGQEEVIVEEEPTTAEDMF